MLVITATSGRAIAQSSAIWPRPRMPISVSTISVSGSIRVSVSGRPISLLWPPSAATVRGDRTAERGEDVLRRGLAARAGDRDDARVAALAHGAAERGHRRELVVGNERRRRPARARVVEEGDAAAERDEQVARPDAARVDLDAGHRPGLALEPAEAERPQLRERERDQARAPSVAQRLPRGLAVVERDRPVGELLALLGALAGDQDDVARRARARPRARSPRRGPARPRPPRPRRRRSRR